MSERKRKMWMRSKEEGNNVSHSHVDTKELKFSGSIIIDMANIFVCLSLSSPIFSGLELKVNRHHPTFLIDRCFCVSELCLPVCFCEVQLKLPFFCDAFPVSCKMTYSLEAALKLIHNNVSNYLHPDLCLYF